jgi:hypothetical protein
MAGRIALSGALDAHWVIWVCDQRPRHAMLLCLSIHTRVIHVVCADVEAGQAPWSINPDQRWLATGHISCRQIAHWPIAAGLLSHACAEFRMMMWVPFGLALAWHALA